MTSVVDTDVGPDQAMRLHRLMTAYLSSQALFCAVQLGLFDALADAPRTPEELGAEVGLPVRPTRILLSALEGEQLVRHDGDRFANTPVAATFLVSRGERYLGALARHQSNHFTKMVNLIDALRTDQPVALAAQYTGEFESGPLAWARRWAEVFRASSHLMADDLAGQIDLAGRKRVVDLGCASCSYSIALARAHRDLEIRAVDLPAVAEIAAEYVAQADLADRIDVRPGNIFEDRFPECDVALLSHVIQGFSRARARTLLAHVYDWLPPGGLVVVHSHLPEQAQLPFPYQFGLILMINNTQGGEAHSQEVTEAWLREVGFSNIRVGAVSPISAVLTATK